MKLLDSLIFMSVVTHHPFLTDKFNRPIADNRAIRLDDYLAVAYKEVTEDTSTDRLKQSPLRLMLRAIGSPALIVNKTGRLISTLFNTFYLPNQRKRLQRYRQNPAAQQMVRASGTARSNPYFLLAECMFGTLPSAFRYFNRLPNNFRALLKHALTEKQINPAYCDPWIVAQFIEKRLL